MVTQFELQERPVHLHAPLDEVAVVRPPGGCEIELGQAAISAEFRENCRAWHWCDDEDGNLIDTLTGEIANQLERKLAIVLSFAWKPEDKAGLAADANLTHMASQLCRMFKVKGLVHLL